MPSSGTSNQFKHLNKVDFPDPDGPIIARTSPLLSSISIPFNTGVLWKDF